MSFECPVCTSLNDDSARVCQSCGAPLQATVSSSGGAEAYHLSKGALLYQSQYRIESHLGTGGFGITYRGIDTRQSTDVAIKELWPEKAARQGDVVTWPSSITPKEKQFQLRKFQLEAEYQARCVHPGIVKVYSWFEQNQTAYIVMEFVQGKSLYQIFEAGGVLSEARVKKYFAQVAEALGAVHDQNFLHRDIKPDNILINPQDNAVLIDFGSTREFIAGQTREMSVTLTKGYAPIEQYSYKSKRWPATDFYSLCASMYEILTGELPTEAVLRVQGDPLIPPRQKNPAISALLESVIINGMKMKVEERFQTADELIEALNGHFVALPLKRARELIKRNKLSEASQKYKAYLASDRNNAEAAVEFAMVQFYADIAQAESAAVQAIQLAPNDGRAYGVLGLLNCQQANWSDAYEHLKKAVSLAPSAAWIQANFAWAAGKNSRWEESREAAERALTLDPNNTFAKGLHAWIAVEHQQWKAAISYAKPAIFGSKRANSANSGMLQQWLYPLLVIALEKVVRTQSINNDVDRSVQEFLSLNDRSSLAWGLQGWREALRSQRDRAAKSFENASKLYNPSAWTLNNLGILYEHLDNLPAAVQSYEKCIQQYPENAYACFRLGTVLAQTGNWPLAKAVLEKAVELNPNCAAAQHNLAWVLLRMPGGKDKSELRDILSTYRMAISFYKEQHNHTMIKAIRHAFSKVGIDL